MCMFMCNHVQFILSIIFNMMGFGEKVQNNDIMQSFEIQWFIFENHTETVVEAFNSHCYRTGTYIYKCTDV